MGDLRVDPVRSPRRVGPDAPTESSSALRAYRSTASSVTVTLHDGSFDRAFAAFVRRCEDDGVHLSVFDLLVFTHLRRHREITTEEAATLCQQSADGARAILDRLRNADLLERLDRSEDHRQWVLSPRSYDGLGLEEDRVRDLGLTG